VAKPDVKVRDGYGPIWCRKREEWKTRFLAEQRLFGNAVASRRHMNH